MFSICKSDFIFKIFKSDVTKKIKLFGVYKNCVKIFDECIPLILMEIEFYYK